MRPSVLLVLLTGCQGILGIPSEGKVGCPEPCTYTVSGRTVHAESTSAPQLGLQNVTVRLTSVTPPLSLTTGTDGAFEFPDLPPGTPLELDLSVPQSDPDTRGILHTRYVLANLSADTEVDLPVVQYRWLAQVAFQCGIFPTLDAALFNPGTTDLNDYFITRSTVIVQVLNEDGNPAELDRADLTVVLNNYLNYQHPPDAMNLSTVCFLEPDLGQGEYKGVNADHSTSGRFVMFRTRSDNGAGTGTGEVRIPGFPTGPVNVASASVGFARIKVGEGVALDRRQRTFERDVYHYFKDNKCTVCHTPGGQGYMQAPVRLGTDGKMYPADWSASVDDVYNALTKPDMAGCDTGTPARVCKAKAEASLLYVNPAGLGDHPGIVLPLDDPMLAAVLDWIKDGAILR